MRNRAFIAGLAKGRTVLDAYSYTGGFGILAAKAGAKISACFVTENSENTFPALPVRIGENVFVWFSTFPNLAAYENHAAALSRSEQWRGQVSIALTGYLERAPEVLKLSPTARSQLRG